MPVLYALILTAMILLIVLGTSVATLLGGIFALRHRDQDHLIVGFSAGAVVGVALFDLLPEAVSLAGHGQSLAHVAVPLGLGFAAYMLSSSWLSDFTKSHAQMGEGLALRPTGILGASSLSLHSVLDGVGIGFAFQVSPAVGWTVAIGVLAHDLSDGINTVTLILKNDGAKSSAMRWLIVDAAAPLVGVASTFLFHLKPEVLGVILAAFCGFFLYIGSSHLIPESRRRHPTILTSVMSALGMAFIYVAIRLAG